jgi:adenylate kinase family enzyme
METLRIVVVSPGDVEDERDIVQRAVDELNRGLAADRNIQLELGRWEADAYPGFHVDGPQGLIDAVLRLGDADLVIGIFWKRFGTPTKSAKSGTAHELGVAIDCWRVSGRPQVMVYFAHRPYTPQSSAETKQWGLVLKFREAFPAEGLWWKYTDQAQFETLLRGHLTNWLRHLRPIQIDQPSSEIIADRQDYIRRYRELIDNAQHDVLIMANKFHRSEALNEAARINESLRAAFQRGVRIAMLNGSGFDRLPGALELAIDCGAEVRFDPDLPMSDMNFACADSHNVLIALRTVSLEKGSYKRSTAWSEFRSTHLAATLRRDFDRRWHAPRTRSLGLLMREVLPAAIRELGVEGVGAQLHVPSRLVKDVVDRPAYVVCLIGRPGAGKTTVASALLQALGRAAPAVRTKYVSDLEFVRRAFSSGETDGRYVPTEDGGFFIVDSTLYSEALVALADLLKTSASECDLLVVEFARNDYLSAFDLLEREGVRIDLIVYLDVPFSVAQERNRNRALSGQGHFVSEREMRETYQTDDLVKLREARGIQVLRNDAFNRITAEQATDTVLEFVRDLSGRAPSQTAARPDADETPDQRAD